jgi:nicotinate-nucleotide pyrophosphorylase (carboxylating)
MGLYDAFLIKDNHITMLGGDAVLIGRKIAVLRGLWPVAGHWRRPRLKKYRGVKIEIEAQSLAQFKAFLPLGADIIMLDNMSSPDMKKAIALNL